MIRKIQDLVRLPASERTRAMEAQYQKDKAEGKLRSLLDEPARARLSENWYLKTNAYPYNAGWQVSDMGVFNREESLENFTDEEKIEFFDTIVLLLRVYDAIKINGYSMQSVRSIPHFHCLKGLIERVEVKNI